MSPANRTAQEMLAVRRALAAGKLSQTDADRKLAALAARGAAYEARWTLPNGKERTKTFSTRKHGKTAEKKAEQYEALMKAQVGAREHVDQASLRATVAEVLDFYIERKMDGRASIKNVRAHRRDIIEAWGDKLTLQRLDRDPDTLIDALRERLEAKHGDHKTAWNRKVTAQAAIHFYLRKKR